MNKPYEILLQNMDKLGVGTVSPKKPVAPVSGFMPQGIEGRGMVRPSSTGRSCGNSSSIGLTLWSGKQPKSHEIIPSTSIAEQGLGEPGSCGCGGACGKTSSGKMARSAGIGGKVTNEAFNAETVLAILLDTWIPPMLPDDITLSHRENRSISRISKCRALHKQIWAVYARANALSRVLMGLFGELDDIAYARSHGMLATHASEGTCTGLEIETSAVTMMYHSVTDVEYSMWLMHRNQLYIDCVALLSQMPWSSRRGARSGGGCHSPLLTKPTLASTCSWTM